jgi:hypothetical protein
MDEIINKCNNEDEIVDMIKNTIYTQLNIQELSMFILDILKMRNQRLLLAICDINNDIDKIIWEYFNIHIDNDISTFLIDHYPYMNYCLMYNMDEYNFSTISKVIDFNRMDVSIAINYTKNDRSLKKYIMYKIFTDKVSLLLVKIELAYKRFIGKYFYF